MTHGPMSLDPNTAGQPASNGFTLLEVLIALLIFMVGILGVASMQTASILGNGKADDTTEAAAFAQKKFEEFRLLDYGDADLADATGVGTETEHTDPSPPTGFTVKWYVDQDNPVDNTKRIRVQVQWQRGSQTRTATVTGYKMDVI